MDWRHYDSAIGRFVTIDPETEDSEQMDKSPYTFALNNPILYDDPDGRNPIKGWIKKILKSFADDAVKIVARNAKGQYKPVSRVQAKKIIQGGGSVTKTTKGSNKMAKKLMNESTPDLRIVRHDGHEIANAQGEKTGKIGLDHYQKKSGDGSHVFYDNTKNTTTVGVGIATISIEESNDTREIAGKAVELGSKISNTVENFGTNVFGNNVFGRFVNEINPLNVGFSDLFKAVDETLNTKKKE